MSFCNTFATGEVEDDEVAILSKFSMTVAVRTSTSCSDADFYFPGRSVTSSMEFKRLINSSIVINSGAER